ncbi:MAG TPA: DUF2244 domain-containing protein [Xanthobacteraceae bacterium]|nr:DUF2244 domain-containing protein [Xanthobacteraceae bacterium]
MTQDNEPNTEPTLFSAIITPHRSLSRAGFLLVMLLIGGVSFVGGAVFFLVGAWPVVGFLGLDVLLVYLAFRANYRAAAAYEQVTVTPSELRLKRVSHRGEAREWTMNPLWTRLERETHNEFGLMRLFLVSRGLRLVVAGFLSPSERESFAHALSAALAEAKRGPTQTAF